MNSESSGATISSNEVVKTLERRVSEIIRPLVEVSLHMGWHQAATCGRKLEHDLHEQASRRHLSRVVIQQSIDIALVITRQGQKHRSPEGRALLAKVHREKECTQHLQTRNATLGLAIFEGPSMLVFP